MSGYRRVYSAAVGRCRPAFFLILLSLGASPSAHARAVDPFYEGLLDRGARELDAGRAAKAEPLLRTACFGFLDQTDLLAEGLVQLGRAQSRTGNKVGLRRTLDRLIEVESLFGAYSALDKPALKEALERDLTQVLPEAEVRATGLFSRHVAVAVPTPRAPLSVRQQRRALEGDLSANPQDREVLWQLAQLDLANGKPKRAGEWLDRLLASHPQDAPALCIRADLAISRRECTPVIAALDCPGLAADEGQAAFVNDCLESAGIAAADPTASKGSFADPTPAADTLPIEEPDDGKSTEELSEPQTIPLDPETPSVTDSASESPEATVQPPGDKAGFEPQESAGPPDAADQGQQLPEATAGDPTLASRLLGLRDEVDKAQVRADLAEPRVQAGLIANDYPDSPAAQYLAAEIAFRVADYPSAVEYFRRAGDPSPEQHVLLFFLAVSLFETEQLEEAERALRLALPKLEASKPSEYVRSYIDKILGAPAE